MSPIIIDGVEYYKHSEVAEELGVSRQTLWRWRRQGSIPVGHRYRDGKTLFTAAEVEAIRQFANRVEPLDEVDANQLKLFNASRSVR